jgi:hypothetical protein
VVTRRPQRRSSLRAMSYATAGSTTSPRRPEAYWGRFGRPRDGTAGDTTAGLRRSQPTRGASERQPPRRRRADLPTGGTTGFGHGPRREQRQRQPPAGRQLLQLHRPRPTGSPNETVQLPAIGSGQLTRRTSTRAEPNPICADVEAVGVSPGLDPGDGDRDRQGAEDHGRRHPRNSTPFPDQPRAQRRDESHSQKPVEAIALKSARADRRDLGRRHHLIIACHGQTVTAVRRAAMLARWDLERAGPLACEEALVPSVCALAGENFKALELLTTSAGKHRSPSVRRR